VYLWFSYDSYNYRLFPRTALTDWISHLTQAVFSVGQKQSFKHNSFKSSASNGYIIVTVNLDEDRWNNKFTAKKMYYIQHQVVLRLIR